jgi:hypothetical protein
VGIYNERVDIEKDRSDGGSGKVPYFHFGPFWINSLIISTIAHSWDDFQTFFIVDNRGGKAGRRDYPETI